MVPPMIQSPDVSMIQFVSFHLPRLRVFPRNVAGVVQVQKQALAAVEKSQADEIVVDECKRGTSDDVQKAEGAVSLGNSQLRAQR